MIKVHSSPSQKQIVERFKILNAAAIELDGLILVSGLTAVDLSTGEMLPGEDIGEHAQCAIQNYETLLGEMGLTLDNVVKVNCFLQEPARDFPRWNEVFKSAFNEPYPCRTTVGAPLVLGLLELDLVVSRQTRQQGL